jgi:flagellar basal body-associated protein FliL
MPDEDTAEPGQSKRRKIVPIVIVAALLALEGGGIYIGMKLFRANPAPVEAAAAEMSDSDRLRTDTVEVPLASTDTSNNLSGRLYIYHIEVSALVAAAKRDEFTKLVEDKKATIQDRINKVIRGAAPKHLNEPGLETIRRQIQFELNKIFGDDSLVLELLIPKLMQSRTRL